MTLIRRLSRESLTPRNLSRHTILALEAISLAAVFGTGEFDLTIAVGLLGFALIARILRGERQALLPNRILFYGLVTLVTLGVTATRKWGVPAVIAATCAALGVLALTWTLEPSRRNIGWRQALSFFLVVLAASITPDFYLAVLIFLYVLFSSLLLLTLFMDSESERTGSRELGQPVSWTFLGQAFLLSFLVFTLSLTIFPILPRSSPLIESLLQPGYSESVDLASPGFGRTTNRAAAIRISAIDESLDPEIWFASLPTLLLRGKILDLFDGTRWLGHPHSLGLSDPTSKSKSAPFFRVRRSPLQTDLLPAFEGSIAMLTESHSQAQGQGQALAIRKSTRGEWVFKRGYGRQVSYQLSWPSTGLKQSTLSPEERVSLLSVPPILDLTDRKKWLDLVRRIKAAPLAPTRARLLRDWFRAQGFRGELRKLIDDQNLQTGTTRPQQGIARLSEFLFRERKGHCELYASSAALLLRLAGTPARIATGFRISSTPVSGILTVREEDAHAWTEYWDERTSTWLTLDLTPSESRSALWDAGLLRKIRDHVEGWWFRYVVVNTDSPHSPFRADDDPLAPKSSTRWREGFQLTEENWVQLGLAALSLSVFSSFAYLLKRHLRRRSHLATGLIEKAHRRDLQKIRLRFERRGLALPRLYDELRFGPISPGGMKWRQSIAQLRAMLNAPK